MNVDIPIPKDLLGLKYPCKIDLVDNLLDISPVAVIIIPIKPGNTIPYDNPSTIITNHQPANID